jgi:hypothetical protein
MISLAFYRLQYIKFILNFARLKNICGILTTYQGFCNLFSTTQNSAMPAVPREKKKWVLLCVFAYGMFIYRDNKG